MATTSEEAKSGSFSFGGGRSGRAGMPLGTLFSLSTTIGSGSIKMAHLETGLACEKFLAGCWNFDFCMWIVEEDHVCVCIAEEGCHSGGLGPAHFAGIVLKASNFGGMMEMSHLSFMVVLAHFFPFSRVCLCICASAWHVLSSTARPLRSVFSCPAEPSP